MKMKKKDIESEINFIIWLHKSGLTNKQIVGNIKSRRKAIKTIMELIKD